MEVPGSVEFPCPERFRGRRFGLELPGEAWPCLKNRSSSVHSKCSRQPSAPPSLKWRVRVTPRLRRRVEALLRAHEQSDDLLDPPEAGMATSTHHEAALAAGLVAEATSPRPITEGPGARIGPYKLLRSIGEGGMGVVFLAEQETPVRRRWRSRSSSREWTRPWSIARFEAERQALALMDHNHIARVFDAGTTETGRPFFVMELVKRRADHRVLRPEPSDAEGAAGTLHAGLPGDPARPPEGDHPPRHQADPTCW